MVGLCNVMVWWSVVLWFILMWFCVVVCAVACGGGVVGCIVCDYYVLSVVLVCRAWCWGS